MKKISDFFKNIKQKIGDFLFKNRYGTIMVFVGIIVAFWDFTTKFLFDEQQVSVINGFFSIFSTHNTGGAWSIFSNATWLLIIFSILFIVAIIVFNYFLKTKTYFYSISLGLLLGGAVCNLYDRIFLGYVRDFIKLDFINFPIFNIADICICVGVALVIVYFAFIAPKIEKKQKDEQNTVEENEPQISAQNEQIQAQKVQNIDEVEEGQVAEIKNETQPQEDENIEESKSSKEAKTQSKKSTSTTKKTTSTTKKTTTKKSTKKTTSKAKSTKKAKTNAN